MKRFEELDHTADVGIRAYGRTLDELFENAAAGMFSLITDLDAVKPVGEYEVKLAAKDCSASMARTYDIEVWIPSMKGYKEVSSVSNAKEKVFTVLKRRDKGVYEKL